MVTREDLHTWAAEHNYPAIQFVGIKPVKFYPVPGLPRVMQPLKYAIGIGESKDNKMFWNVAIGLGTKDMIDSLLVYINSLSAEQLEGMRKPKAARARERGIRFVRP